MRIARFFLLGPFILFLAACTSVSQFVGNGETDLHLPDPENDILILFARGAGDYTEQDPCIPQPLAVFGGFSTPRVLARLAKRRGDVHLFYVCDRDPLFSEGQREERKRAVPCQTGHRFPDKKGGPDSGLPLKVCQRADALEKYANYFLGANPGLKSDRIFLTGTSTGGWASLLVAARNPTRAFRVIAFAPAFAGKNSEFRAQENPPFTIDTIKCGPPFGKGDKGYVAVLPPGDFRRQDDRRDLKNIKGSFRPGEELFFCHSSYLSARAADALIFGFHGDPYQDADSLSHVVDGALINALCRDGTRPLADFDCDRWGTPDTLCFGRDKATDPECANLKDLASGVFAPRRLSNGLKGSVLIAVPDETDSDTICRTGFAWIPGYPDSPHACNQRVRFDRTYGPVIEAYIDCRTGLRTGEACARFPEQPIAR